MASGDPIRVFIAHGWHESDDYQRLVELLAGARGFHFLNCSEPERRPAGGTEAERDELRRQISRAEAVIGLAEMIPRHLALLHFEVVYAQSLDRPVLLLPAFGRALPPMQEFKGLIDEEVPWDERALVASLRRHARHEDSQPWDVIEFRLD